MPNEDFMELPKGIRSVFLKRRDVALAKVAANYRPEYFQGVVDTYNEILRNLGVE